MFLIYLEIFIISSLVCKGRRSNKFFRFWIPSKQPLPSCVIFIQVESIVFDLRVTCISFLFIFITPLRQLVVEHVKRLLKIFPPKMTVKKSR
ncbi:hypothetical protein Hanom_Chr13g01229551 [Helianthus anomalus]